jgi:hypothetical protein
LFPTHINQVYHYQELTEVVAKTDNGILTGCEGDMNRASIAPHSIIRVSLRVANFESRCDRGGKVGAREHAWALGSEEAIDVLSS